MRWKIGAALFFGWAELQPRPIRPRERLEDGTRNEPASEAHDRADGGAGSPTDAHVRLILTGFGITRAGAERDDLCITTTVTALLSI